MCSITIGSANQLEEVDVTIATTFVDILVIVICSREIVEKEEFLSAESAFYLQLLSHLPVNADQL